MKTLSRVQISKPSHVLILLFGMTLLLTALFSVKLAMLSVSISSKIQEKATEQENKITHYEISATPTVSPVPSGSIKTTIKEVVPKNNSEPWGVAKQIDEYTWTMKVADDEKMSTPQELLEALNRYRQQKGSGTLSWDDKLADFAKKRAETFNSIGKLDSHAGFMEYFKEEQHLKDIGFSAVGENSSYGFKMHGVHLIEWVFAGDKPHDDNQRDNSWTHVGIGIVGTSVDVIFGKEKM